VDINAALLTLLGELRANVAVLTIERDALARRVAELEAVAGNGAEVT